MTSEHVATSVDIRLAKGKFTKDFTVGATSAANIFAIYDVSNLRLLEVNSFSHLALARKKLLLQWATHGFFRAFFGSA
jgi:hypothetical protein